MGGQGIEGAYIGLGSERWNIQSAFYPFQNKHQIHQHLESVKMCAFKKSKYRESHEIG